MVQNIWFFSFRIITPEYFWFIIFCICLNSSCASFGEEIISRVVFALINMTYHFGGRKKCFALKSHQNKDFQILFQQWNVILISYFEPNFIETSFEKGFLFCFVLFFFQIFAEIVMT